MSNDCAWYVLLKTKNVVVWKLKLYSNLNNDQLIAYGAKQITADGWHVRFTAMLKFVTLYHDEA